MCSNIVSHYCPTIISHHMGVPNTLISWFNDLYIMVKSFPLLITDSSKIFRKSIKVGKQEVDFNGHLNLKHCKGAWPKLVLSLRSDDLTYNPSLFVLLLLLFFVLFCFFCFFFKYQLCKWTLSILTLSLGVKTPHVTPVLYGNWVCSLNFQA